jgi:nitrite reductase (NO-forming)
MRKIILLSGAVIFICSCKNNSNSGGHNDMVYGSPQAVVSSQPNNEKAKGPIGFGAGVPPLMQGDTIDVKFDATHKIFHVGSEIAYMGWTFGDSIPGPIIHVKVGQTIRFAMTDRSNDTMQNQAMHMNMKPMQHSIDFHAAMVNPADKYRTIQPGETIHFTWTANYPGVFMYHCATPSVLVHISNGMFGMVIVEPRDGYPTTVDTEFALVQNEYYLKQNGDAYVMDTAAARTRQPSYVTFNGKIGQYIIHPLKVKAGKRVRVYFLNVGPNNISNFHVIGTILDKVWLDGNPKNQLVGMQSVLVGPASGAIMEFVLPEPGRYPFVDHSFANAEAGATGEFLAE